MVTGNAFVILNLGFHVVDGVRGPDLRVIIFSVRVFTNICVKAENEVGVDSFWML